MKSLTRKASVSGQFYSSEASEIIALIGEIVNKEKPNIDTGYSGNRILGAVLPHAGHIYSGFQTIHFFEILKYSQQAFDTWVIIHPVHTAGELDYAAEGSDFWHTPLGNVPVDKELMFQLEMPISCRLHKTEHSAEVILPFIQNYYGNDFSLVSIGILRQDPDIVKIISNKISNALRISKKKICIIASSDFSHYLNPETGFTLDQKVIDRILLKDVQGIYDVVTKHNISVCGYGPIMVLCETLNQLYPEAMVKVLARGNSGQVHPSSRVVDYVSMLFHE